MFLPLRTDSPLRSTPWMNWALIGANVAAYIAQHSVSRHGYQQFVLDRNDLHVYSYITYQFLHNDPWHIIGNMLFLYIFGNNVNDKLGNLGYLAFYLAGGVFAGIGFILTSGTSVIGASGAVAAVTGAYLVLFPRSHITILYFFFLIGTLEIPCMWFIAFFFAQDIVLNMINGAHENVAHTAHIAGTMFGFAICISLLAARMLPRDQFDILALIQRWNRRRTYRGMVSQGYNPFGYGPEVAATAGAKEPLNPNMDRIQDLRAEISEAVAHSQIEKAAALFLDLHAIDPQQVLARQTQLDIANQLASSGQYREAADAYEALLRFYRTAGQSEQVELMLGLIYARYLNDAAKAKGYLNSALEKLHGQREIDLARAELARIGS